VSLPDKFWLNGRTGQIVPVDDMHLLTIMSDPEQFGFSRDDINLDQNPLELNRLAYGRGWIRVDGSSSDTINMETNHLRDAAEGLKHLLDQGEFYTDAFIDMERGTVELEGIEEIEAFALKDRLPRRYAALQTSLLHTRKPIVGPADAVIEPMRAEIGHAVGERMEPFLRRARDLFEFEKPNGESGDEPQTFDSEMDPRLPTRRLSFR
jgi:hypothetical protein